MEEPSAAGEAPERRPFAAFLQEHRSGGLHAELSAALAELVAATREHEKGGTLTLVVKVAPNKGTSTVTVTDDVKVSAPKGDRGAALYFTDDRGNLSRRNPAQLEIPLKEVPASPESAVVVDLPHSAQEAKTS